MNALLLSNGEWKAAASRTHSKTLARLRVLRHFIGGALTCVCLQAQTPLVDLYKWFHTHPELSYAERETSKRFAEELRAAGFAVTENVGGFGVVAVLKNGAGPTALFRTD